MSIQSVEDFLRLQGEISPAVSQVSGSRLQVLGGSQFGFKTRTLLYIVSSSFTTDDADSAIREFRENRIELSLDYLLIISENGISSQAEMSLSFESRAKHLLASELLEGSIDFSPYLHSLVSAWDNRKDGVSRYCIPLKTQSGRLLDEVVGDWIVGSDRAPVAILGSYGIGKSVFASKLARDLAESCINAPENARIPILIRLGELAYEQNLEGLLGSALTAIGSVRNFSFPVFCELNRKGKFVVIFDAFDEMKQGITWEVFRYNLSQLNRLVDGDSRVILLGRPTAFMDEHEVQEVLHGRRYLAGQFIPEPDWPDYCEIEISLLDDAQISRYINDYLKYQHEAAGERNTMRLTQRIASVGQQIENPHIHDIATRPVQLKMLLDVLPNWTRSLHELTLSDLYNDFIDRTIEREAERPSRSRYNVRQRHAFARELAWWMWTQPRSLSATVSSRLSAADIPIDLLKQFSESSSDLEVSRRDLVAACFLDKRSGGDLVFPHRSFQEFLVAEHVNHHFSQRDDISIAKTLPYITPEISGFMIELMGPNVSEGLNFALENFKGTLPWYFLRSWAQSAGKQSAVMVKISREIKSRELHGSSGSTPWWSLIATSAYCTDTFTKDPSPVLLGRLKESSAISQDAAVYLFCILLIAEKRKSYTEAAQALSTLCGLGTTYEAFADSMPNQPHKVLRSWRERGGQRIEIFEPVQGAVEVLGKVSISTRRGTRYLNVQGLRTPLLTAMRDYASVAEFSAQGSDSRVLFPFPSQIPLRDPALWDKITSFQSDYDRPID